MHDYISQIENLECKQFVLFLDQKKFPYIMQNVQKKCKI